MGEQAVGTDVADAGQDLGGRVEYLLRHPLARYA